ncbi:MAG: hypothetical protein IKF64_02375 [Eubacterium sp.]|nr:hypothetical protein [Eubacterium sp.]
MAIYNIAGLSVKIENCGGRTAEQAKAYLAPDQSENANVDIYINVDSARVKRAVDEHPELTAPDWDYMLSGDDFYTSLLDFDGILLHSSCVVVDGVAYAFSADSGVGKSTHTQLWLRHFGDRAYILNDDKPAIRKIDGVIYACGTPWSGKHDCSVPEIVPLGGICFLERGEVNRIEKAPVKEAAFNIFSQTVRKLGAAKMEKLLDVIESIFSCVPLYQLSCNISDEAVEVAYGAMKRDITEIINEK